MRREVARLGTEILEQERARRAAGPSGNPGIDQPPRGFLGEDDDGVELRIDLAGAPQGLIEKLVRGDFAVGHQPGQRGCVLGIVIDGGLPSSPPRMQLRMVRHCNGLRERGCAAPPARVRR